MNKDRREFNPSTRADCLREVTYQSGKRAGPARQSPSRPGQAMCCPRKRTFAPSPINAANIMSCNRAPPSKLKRCCRGRSPQAPPPSDERLP